jgi:hypothetical protein
MPAGPSKITGAPLTGRPPWSRTVAVRLLSCAASVRLAGEVPGTLTLTSGVGSLSAPSALYARTTT